MGLVIIKSPFNLSVREFKICYDSLVSQKEKGVILLPPEFEAIYVPDDVEIKMEEAFKEEEKNECSNKRDLDY